MIVGNDVSKWQGDINFDTYKNNTNFLLAKCSEGVGFTDPKFNRNKTESARVGIPFGSYHFARPDLKNTPEAEASYYLKTVGTLANGEVLCLDYEPPAWSGDPVNWCLQFLRKVEADTRVKPFIYLNQSQAKSFNWKPVVDNGNALWLACYTYDPNNNACTTGAWGTMAMQQWTNKQQVPGISGDVDGNAFFGDLNQFKQYGYTSPTPPPTTPPPNCEKWNALCASLELDPETSTPEQVVKIIGGYKSAATTAQNKLAEYQGQVTNLSEQVERLKTQIASLETNQVSLTEQLKAKQAELDEMARLKGEVVIKLQGVTNELEALKKQVASQEVTITRKQLWKLLVDGKLTIKR